MVALLENEVDGKKASLVFEPKTPVSRPGMLDRWRLKGLPTTSPPSMVAGDIPSGGVPAFALVELTDWGVPASVSSDLRCGDFRVAAASLMGSAECCRLSCKGLLAELFDLHACIMHIDPCHLP